MKKLIAYILLSAFCLTVISCSDNVSDNTIDTATAAETIGSETDYLETLPNKNYQGNIFTIVGKYDEGGAFNFPREAEDGDVVNDALFRRAREIEELYNIKFVYVKTGSGGDTVTKVTESALTGDVMYEMIQGSMLTCTGILLKQGYLSNVFDLPYIDINQPWWTPNLKTDLIINGNLYFLTGVIMFEHYREAGCVIFNKAMAENYQIGNLYDNVYNDTWTLNKFIETTKNASSDINGDGIMNTDDQYGFCIGDITGYDFYFGAGMRITYLDADKNLYIEAAPSQNMVEVVETLSDFFGKKDICIDNYDYQNTNAEDVIFTEGRSLYLSGRMGDVIGLRSAEIDFGVLPVPKFTDDQEKYYSYANPWMGSSIAFPLTLGDEEMVSLVTEAMAYKSKLYLEPVMYDNLLKTRASRDNESLEMLDIIYYSKTFDLCDIFEWGGLNYLIRNAVLARDGSNMHFVSDYRASVNNATAGLNNLIESAAEIKG